MYKRSWREIEPILENDGQCFARYYFRRRDQLSQAGGIKVTKYWEWVKYVTVPWGRKPAFKRQNLEKILFIVHGEGEIESAGKSVQIRSQDTVYVPPEKAYLISSTVEHQPIMYMEYCVRAPPEAAGVISESLQENEAEILVERWTSKKPRPGHEGTCYSYSIFTRNEMKYLLFASMMTVPNVLGYHSHNSEAIYFIVSGRGRVKVSGEEAEVCEGDAVYIPPGMAHRCYNMLADQPLNVFCQGIADPYDAKVVTLENLPDTPV